MNILSRKPSLTLLALATALMMPLAFAQSTNPTGTASQSATQPPPAATSIAPTRTPPADVPTASSPNTAPSSTPAQSTTPSQSTTTATAQSSDTTSPNPSATATAPAAKKSGSKGQKTWEELDTNKDGNLSKAEAAADPTMKQIFDKADANGDGVLTPDEYRAYYEANYQASAPRHK